MASHENHQKQYALKSKPHWSCVTPPLTFLFRHHEHTHGTPDSQNGAGGPARRSRGAIRKCVIPFLILSFLIGDAITRMDVDSRNRIGEWKNRKQEGTAGLDHAHSMPPSRAGCPAS